MAEINELTDEQLIVYANMLVTKGNTIRREIMRKRKRVEEIDESILTEPEKNAIKAAIIPGFNQIIASARDEQITADLVILSMQPETPPDPVEDPEE